MTYVTEKSIGSRKGHGSKGQNHDPMHLGALSDTALRLARFAAPPYPPFPGADSPAFLGFLSGLFANERQDDLPELIGFLERCTNQDTTRWLADPWFPNWAELVHEYAWTSPEGCAAVGFPDSDHNPVTIPADTP